MEIPNTPRIRFRKFKAADLELVYQLNSNAQVMEYILGPRNKEEVKEDLQKYLSYSQKHPRFGYWAAIEKQTDQFIGWFVLKILKETNECEIGYRLLPEFWGQGFATEGAKAWLQYGFEQLRHTRIVAVVLPENKASRRVLEKSGLRFDHVGYFYDCECAYYSLDHSYE